MYTSLLNAVGSRFSIDGVHQPDNANKDMRGWEENMDREDKNILNILQEGIPLHQRPYRAIGEKVGLCEEEVLSRIKNMKKGKIIRHMGFLFNYKKLLFTSTLVAMKVPKERLNEVAEMINSYPEVTHNYAREDEFNLWFVLVAESTTRIKKILGEIRAKTELEDILELPMRRKFKLKLNLNPEEGLSQ